MFTVMLLLLPNNFLLLYFQTCIAAMLIGSVLQLQSIKASLATSFHFIGSSELPRTPLSFCKGFALDPLGKWVSLQHPQTFSWIRHSKPTVFVHCLQLQECLTSKYLLFRPLSTQKRKFIYIYLISAQSIKINS